MKLRAILALPIILILSTFACPVDPVQAQSPTPGIEVSPASVEVPPQGEAEVLVVARNTTTGQFRDVQLSWFTDAGVEIDVESPASDVLAPQGALAWTLRISQSGGEQVAGTVHIRVDYVWQAEGETQGVAGVALGTLRVQPREPQAIQQVAQISVETALTSLMEHRPGTIYLVVKNTSSFPIQVTRVSASVPDFLICTPPESEPDVMVTPQGVSVFAFDVSASEAVRPGKHLLLFEVAFEWEQGGASQSGTSVVTHEVEVGVLGESEVLTLIGVPSFLFLPGFLMLATIGFLYKRVTPRADFPIEAKSAEFWMLAITLSILVAILYPPVTDLFGVRRNYLEGYGLGDVVRVWFSSVIVAAVGFILTTGGVSLGKRFVQWRRRQEAQLHTPSADDTPLTILEKLARNELGIQCDRVDVTVDGVVQRAYVLQPRKEGQEKIWVGPAILVTWAEGADQSLYQRVQEHLGPGGDPAELAAILGEGEARGALQVSWKPIGQLREPLEVSVEDIQGELAPTPIVEED